MPKYIPASKVVRSALMPAERRELGFNTVPERSLRPFGYSRLYGQTGGDASCRTPPPPERTSRVPRPVRPPPLGKSAAYIATLKNRGEYEDDEGDKADEEEGDKEKSKGKKGRANGKLSVPVAKKTTNPKKKASERENKKALEVAAVARAASAATKKKLAQLEERMRLEKEEKRGADARDAVLAAAQHPANVSSKAAGNRKRKTSPHVAEEEVEEADDVSDFYDVAIARAINGSVRNSLQDRLYNMFGLLHVVYGYRYDFYRSLVMEDGGGQEAGQAGVTDEPVAALTVDGGMDSEVEGASSDSGSWYMNPHEFEDEGTEEKDKVGMEDKSEEGGGESGGTEEQEGIAIEARRCKNKYKRLAAKLLKESHRGIAAGLEYDDQELGSPDTHGNKCACTGCQGSWKDAS
ncbi:unnamed protein product [Phytophthora fragariaefolia]|uniref:Unnamed protein product n=1 Tax=Phytophthora fragariaefolia TaxID=1490495 RepID=A0A9W6TLT7_9STRA|nr:unnamed protein product [Phytophthora fragariaefolia]